MDDNKPQEVSGSVKAPGWMISGIVMALFGLAGLGAVATTMGAKTPPLAQPVVPAVTEAQVVATAKHEAVAAAKVEVSAAEARADAIRAQQRVELLQALERINGKLDTISVQVGEVRGRLKMPVR